MEKNTDETIPKIKISLKTINEAQNANKQINEKNTNTQSPPKKVQISLSQLNLDQNTNNESNDEYISDSDDEEEPFLKNRVPKKGRGGSKFTQNREDFGKFHEDIEKEKSLSTNLTSNNSQQEIEESPSMNEIDLDEYLVEISDFSMNIQEKDISFFLKDFGTFNTKWVSDTKVIIIFPDPKIAFQCCTTLNDPNFTIKRFIEASKESKAIRKTMNLNCIPRERGKTSVSVARKFIGEALSIPSLQEKNEEDISLENQRKKKKEEKNDSEIQKEEIPDAWYTEEELSRKCQ